MKSLTILQKVITLFFVSSLFLTVPGCTNFYKVMQQQGPVMSQAQQHIDAKRYLIVHQNFDAWRLSDARTQGDTLIGRILPLPINRLAFMRTKVKGYNRYRYNERNILDESHFYLKGFVFPDIDSLIVNIPDTSIHHIDTYKAAVGRTIVSWIGPVVIPIGVIAIIAALTSCPYVYTYGSDGYILTGEMYGGAIYPALERNDYMQLPEAAVFKDKVKLKLSNELKECQHTNLVELLLVSHPAGSQAYADKYGNILTTCDEKPPISAITTGGFEFTNQLIKKDLDCFLFNEENAKSSVNELILSFKIPIDLTNGNHNIDNHNIDNLKNDNLNNNNLNTATSNTAKLVVNAKNSLWADYAFNEFYSLMGTYYPKWNAQQKELDKQKLTRQMLDQDTPLSVYLETESGWKFVDFYNFTGPIAARNMILQVDLSQAKLSPSNTIRLKLVSGFLFWELDYAAMDFSENLPVTSSVIKATSAVDEQGTDVLATLSGDDNRYLVQPDIGNEVLISFDIISPANTSPENMSPANTSVENTTPVLNITNENTLFLHSKGYYEKNAEYTGNPNWFKLLALKHKHSFSDFSHHEYLDYLKESGYVNAELKTLNAEP